ncbi:MAG: DnaD domain protein [Methylocystaceae bacterium]
MVEGDLIFEAFRWGFAQVPAVIYSYASELGLDVEDLGIMGAVFLALSRRYDHNLLANQLNLGQVSEGYPGLSKSKLIRRLARWENLGIVTVEPNDDKDWQLRSFNLTPLFSRLGELLYRDNPVLAETAAKVDKNTQELENRIQEYEQKLKNLEEQMADQDRTMVALAGDEYRQIADFVAKKTGNLLSGRMARELRKWVEEMGFEKEFLLAMLELCIEREINNPREITAIARGIKETGISNLEGMEAYFKRLVDNEPAHKRLYQFDPEINEFATVVGIDMGAEARRRMYYKWRYDWQFSSEMIIKAGEIMSQRTRNGGLEYVDTVLANWRAKNIRTREEADNELLAFKRSKEKKPVDDRGPRSRASNPVDNQIYVAPAVLEKLKSGI